MTAKFAASSSSAGESHSARDHHFPAGIVHPYAHATTISPVKARTIPNPGQSLSSISERVNRSACSGPSLYGGSAYTTA